MAPTETRRSLARAHQRPLPEQWAPDEPMTLAEAVAVFCPGGPLTLYSFRTAARRGELAIVIRAGKYLTTPHAVRIYLKPCPAAVPSRRDFTSYGTGPGLSATADISCGRAAQAAARTRLRALRKSPAIISAPAAADDLGPERESLCMPRPTAVGVKKTRRG